MILIIQNIKRHKTLKLLAEKRILGEIGELKEPLGVKYEDIYKYIKCNKKEAVLIFSKLFRDEEVAFHNAYDIVGLSMTKEGLSSYSSKKYIQENKTILTNYLKNFVQIFIPIASLTIAFLALTNRQLDLNERQKIENKKFEARIDAIEKKINKTKCTTSP
jgi:hypothetical protein